MAAFLYWNTNKKSLSKDVALLCDEYGVDVLALAECDVPVADVLGDLNSGVLRGFSFVANPNLDAKLKWFTRLPASRVVRVLDGGGLSLLRVELLNERIVLLCAVHLPSKINEDDYEQLVTAEAAAQVIGEVESEQGIVDTVVFGDFNMNPFDKGMVSITGFNAVMDRRVAARGKVSYKGKQYPCFYNPMWSCLGDASRGPPGSFWYPRRLARFYWNTYDQVIFRPTLLNFIDDDSVRVIDQYGGKFIAGSGMKWACPSDHLPVFVKIKEAV